MDISKKYDKYKQKYMMEKEKVRKLQTGGLYSKYDSLSPTFLVDEKRAQAHKAGYDLLNHLDSMINRTSPETKFNTTLTIGTAESLTGGLIFSTLVDIPAAGPNKYGCFGVYDTDAKRVFLGVEVKDVYTHKCAKEMAVGVLKNSNASLAIAVTGNSMPWPTMAQKVGEVFIGIAGYVKIGGITKIAVETKVYNFCHESNSNICKLWYNTPHQKKQNIENQDRLHNMLNAALGSKLDRDPKPPTQEELEQDQYADIEITSIMSLYIRNAVVEQAFKDCLTFVNNNPVCVPDFMTDSYLEKREGGVKASIILNRNGSNNKNLNNRNIQIVCKNVECDNFDRLGDNGMKPYIEYI